MKGSPHLPGLAWWGKTDTGHLAILVLLLVGHAAAMTYKNQTCYCVTGQDSTIRSAIANFTEPPEVSRFEYVGAKYNATNNHFDPCVCTDVVRVVTELAVTEQYVLQMAEDNSTVYAVNDNVTRALDDLAEATFQNNSLLKYNYHSAFAEYKETNNSRALFSVEFVVKGSDYNIKDKVAQVMRDAVASNTLAGVGDIDNFTMPFSLRTCPQDPGPAPANTQVTRTSKVAGTAVTYSCKPGFMVRTGEASKAQSTCVHENLTWSSPSPAITCVEDMRCHGRPPSFTNTIQRWSGKIEEGTEVIYFCNILYKTMTNNSATYQCQNKTWTRMSSAVNCQLPTCGDPPQVPDHGVLSYIARDEIVYHCDTYAIRSGVDAQQKITCENGTWEELPETFTCYGSDVYDTHQEWENFLHITLPVSLVMVFVVILCLLCTRTDSPVCQICNGGQKEVM
ncbi:uncharacterized protein LOC126995633 [Eriocheir sinensis]|uniref:uncharacterized protein LOC126995633 n=1 Tax=Eriocheir sinensis TaxID=95602 RepID=UPI0021C64F61|nr:uncharacterized protein LOC126995633 [Eriocheir sinensis]